MSQPTEQLMHEIVETLKEKKGIDIVTLNLQEVSLLADYFVICHGNSTTQVQSLASEVMEKVEKLGLTIRRMEGFDAARWVLIDVADVIVHIFHREERQYYNLERLWSDAKVIEHA